MKGVFVNYSSLGWHFSSTITRHVSARPPCFHGSKEMRWTERLKELTAELSQVQGRIKSMKNQGKVNLKSLRAMKDVEMEVNKLLDKSVGQSKRHSSRRKSKEKRRRSRRYVSSSSEELSSTSDSDYSSSDSSSQSDSSTDSLSDEGYFNRRKKSKKHKYKHRRSKKSGKASRRSGKDKKISSNVKFPQQWPHSNLSLHFVSKNKKYDDLSIEEFCAGYATIITNSKSNTEQKHRITHLKDLMYLATKYRWDCVLSFHAACLLEIERATCAGGIHFSHCS